MDRKKGNFAQHGQHKDWILLVETLLEWEQWLRSPRMERKHVVRSEQKHRYIMFLIKKIGRRSKGMGLMMIKFHMIIHMTQNMLIFGVPMEYDTGSNESHHKVTKAAAKLTQRKEETFDQSINTRVAELYLLELAREEMLGRPLWNYFIGHHHREVQPKNIGEPRLGGAAFEVTFDANIGQNCIQMTTRSLSEEGMIIETDLVEFVAGLQDCVVAHMPKVPMYTTHTRHGTIFRASPKFQGDVWRDWVMVDWGPSGKSPCKIYGFVDLSALPENSRISYGGIQRIHPAI